MAAEPCCSLCGGVALRPAVPCECVTRDAVRWALRHAAPSADDTGALLAAVMRKLRGQANPAEVLRLIREETANGTR